MNTAIRHQNDINIHVHQAHPTQHSLKTASSRMTEVIIPQTSNSDNIIFPLIASMTKQNAQRAQERWVTWITDRKPNYQQLRHFGASVDSLRIIHVEKNNDNRWIIWDALNTGNSHTVIADTMSMNDSDIEKFEIAAINGQCS